MLPALGEVRLGEITTPLVDRVIQSIKKRVGAPTARSSRSVISGVLGLAARHGAIITNPVRDAENVPSTPNRRPRALNDDERREWFATLSRDPKAVAADLPDLTLFLLATGVRIGEALGLLWSEVDVDAGMIAITGQVTRVTGGDWSGGRRSPRPGSGCSPSPAGASRCWPPGAVEGSDRTSPSSVMPSAGSATPTTSAETCGERGRHEGARPVRPSARRSPAPEDPPRSHAPRWRRRSLAQDAGRARRVGQGAAGATGCSRPSRPLPRH